LSLKSSTIQSSTHWSKTSQSQSLTKDKSSTTWILSNSKKFKNFRTKPIWT
jgi:hypothetical protein